MQTTFADTILNIAVTGGLVRIDLGVVTPVPNQEGKTELRGSATQQLVMPLEGFVRSFGIQEGIIKKLIEDGVLKQQEKPAEVAAAQ